MKSKIYFLLYSLPIIMFHFLVFKSEVGQGPSTVITSSLATGGLTPPNGYPLYSLISDLFLKLPFANPYLKLNLAQTASSLLITYFIYLIIVEIGQLFKFTKTDILLSHSLCLILLFTTESYLRILSWSDRYLVALLFLLISFYLFLKNRIKPNLSLRDVFCLSFIFCLTMTTHGLMVPTILFLTAILFLKFYKTITKKIILTVLLANILAFSIYLYLPVKAFSNPFINWGNTTNALDFYNYLTRFEYGYSHFVGSWDQVQIALITFFHLTLQTYHFILIFFLMGLLNLSLKLKKKELFFLYFCLLILGPLTAISVYHNSIEQIHLQKIEYWILKNYFLPVYFFISLVTGLGLTILANNFPKYKKHTIVFLILTLLVFSSTKTFNHINTQSPTVKITNSLITRLEKEKSCLFITDIDNIYFPLMEKQIIDKRLSNCLILHSTLWFRPWYLSSVKSMYAQRFPILNSQELLDFKTLMENFEHSFGKTDKKEALESYNKLFNLIISDFDKNYLPIYYLNIPNLGNSPFNFINQYQMIPREFFFQISKKSIEMISDNDQPKIDPMFLQNFRKNELWSITWLEYYNNLAKLRFKLHKILKSPQAEDLEIGIIENDNLLKNLE